MREKVIVTWSGGKDSTIALHEILKFDSYEIVALLTTVAREHERISIHDVRCVLLEHKVKALRRS
jgi:diphthamide synthase (EF-2-diphthine--ammonia ligase)